MGDNSQANDIVQAVLAYEKSFKYQKQWGFVPQKFELNSTEYRKMGNELYARKNHAGLASHTRILSLYSQSIAHAPNNSEELAMALGNRSALWLHIQKYDHCLTDIERALSITSSKTLKYKLLSRQRKCLEHNQTQLQSRVESPNFTASKSVSCAADCIRLDYNDKIGRHYIATRDIKPGEIIVSEESPHLHVQSTQMYLVCSYCFSFAWAGIPCDSCVFAMYCSEKCKAEAWTQYHDIHCSIISTLQCKGLQDKNLYGIASIARMMIIMIRKEGIRSILEEAEKMENRKASRTNDLLGKNEFNCKEFKFIFSLMGAEKNSHHKELDSQLSGVLSLLLNFLQEQCELSECKVDRDTLVVSMKMVLHRVAEIKMRNTIEPSDCTCLDVISCGEYCPSQRGAILSPCCSLINHDCDPNVAKICVGGPKVVMFTERPVKKGEQLVISYGPSIMMPREERRKILLETLEFLCECQACNENWPVPPPSLTNKQLEQLWSQLPGDFLRRCQRIADTPQPEWSYSKESLNDAIEMVTFIYKNLDRLEAYIVAEPYRWYISSSFNYLYGERFDFPNTC